MAKSDMTIFLSTSQPVPLPYTPLKKTGIDSIVLIVTPIPKDVVNYISSAKRIIFNKYY